ncbi:hypothetical protein F6B43_09375 [Microbacterium rhizomatis]|uniref:Uncharacterized protein n=1 Tax=Microbacterium rhizomatis TaxID=1631477 RepID=A0A5J5J284_9MICO|nr:hypothetical protein F6B43_09375 [Microbacterium rhizomatis]
MRRRPVIVTLAIVVVYVSGLGNAALGLLILLSRYDVQGDAAILTVSLLGAGTILLGLLTVAIASGLSRGSRFARILITVYFGIQIVLHVLTIVDADTWDVTATIQIVFELLVIAVVWLPPGARFFRPVPASGAGAAAS